MATGRGRVGLDQGCSTFAPETLWGREIPCSVGVREVEGILSSL
jgi:hypothetical protein